MVNLGKGELLDCMAQKQATKCKTGFRENKQTNRDVLVSKKQKLSGGLGRSPLVGVVLFFKCVSMYIVLTISYICVCLILIRIL